MDSEEALNATFLTLLLAGLLIRTSFAFRVWQAGERIRADRAARRREGVWAHVVAYLFLLLLVALAVHIVFHGGSLRSFAFPSPTWLRWIGVALGIASAALFVWTHVVLGRFWSPYVQLRPGHRLITAGPYARIRHPMYSAIVGWMISLGLVAANWIPLACAALGALQFLLRIGGEETMMLQQFGDEYREYTRRTGRLLPAWSGQARPASETVVDNAAQPAVAADRAGVAVLGIRELVGPRPAAERRSVSRLDIIRSFIRNLSAPAEFVLVVLVCFWWGIAGSIGAILSRLWGVSSTAPYTDSRDLILVTLELSGLAVTFWIARIRGWSFRSFGMQPAWRSTGAGIFLCIAAASARYVSAVLANAIFPGAVRLLPVASHVSLFMLIVTLAINPVFEEMIETGYFVRSLERYGMWVAVLASALFRAFLHAYLGVNAIVVVFPIGLIFGFFYWRRRQLWPLVVAHVLFDFYALFPRSHAG